MGRCMLPAGQYMYPNGQGVAYFLLDQVCPLQLNLRGTHNPVVHVQMGRQLRCFPHESVQVHPFLME
jgi:hypothetical protein